MRSSIWIILMSVSTLICAQKKGHGIGESEQNSLNSIRVGEMAPLFSSDDFDLKSSLLAGPVVIIFYRGYWCPYCSKHLSEFQDNLEALNASGVQVVAVTSEASEGIDKTRNKTEWSSVVVHDKDKSIMKDYGVLFKVTKGYQLKINTFLLTDIANNNEDDEAFLPIPATYLIGQDGLVKYV